MATIDVSNNDIGNERNLFLIKSILKTDNG
jgi:hypothetical protein